MNIQEIAIDAINKYKNWVIDHGIIIVDGKSYPRPLPRDLKAWHIYMQNSGHSILCIPAEYEKIAFSSQDKLFFLIPMQVKKVLSHHRVRDGFIICTSPL